MFIFFYNLIKWFIFFAVPEDFAKEPLSLPPHLQLTLLNVPANDTSGKTNMSESRQKAHHKSMFKIDYERERVEHGRGGDFEGIVIGFSSGNCSNSILPRPGHVILNHVYLDKASRVREVIVLGTTHRYKAKYVTQLHYKPMNR